MSDFFTFFVPIIPLLMIGVVVGVVVAAIISSQRKRSARVAHARALAERYGFNVDVSTKSPPHQQFDLFDIGSSKKVRFQFWRDGEHDSVFDYEYTVSSGDNKTTHRRTVALIALPFAAPHTKIGPEGFWSGVGRLIGVRDIEVESAEFNKQYRVTSDDERFAIALLDPKMMAWMLSSQSGRGSIRFELWGSWLLCESDRLRLEQMFGFLDWSQNVRSHMPDVLTSLYPFTGPR